MANAWPDFATVAQRSKDALTLDLSGVDNIDTAGLAWLIHLVGVARASNVALYFSAIPERLTSLAKISNVEDLLQVQ
ncbi:hypothetical protein TK45_10070 [Bowmanella sp. JS7-9]|nr:hypothetical protein TK45_10070 [Bowmanella sp. JS7-9]